MEFKCGKQGKNWLYKKRSFFSPLDWSYSFSRKLKESYCWIGIIFYNNSVKIMLNFFFCLVFFQCRKREKILKKNLPLQFFFLQLNGVIAKFSFLFLFFLLLLPNSYSWKADICIKNNLFFSQKNGRKKCFFFIFLSFALLYTHLQ